MKMTLLYLCTEESARRLAGGIGELLEIEDLAYARGFLWVRVMVNNKNPLVPGVWLPRIGDRDIWIELRYERLQDFCYRCGRIGHVNTNCSFWLNWGRSAGYGEWTKMKMIRKMHDVPRPMVIYMGEHRRAGTSIESRRTDS